MSSATGSVVTTKTNKIRALPRNIFYAFEAFLFILWIIGYVILKPIFVESSISRFTRPLLYPGTAAHSLYTNRHGSKILNFEILVVGVCGIMALYILKLGWDIKAPIGYYTAASALATYVAFGFWFYRIQKRFEANKNQVAKVD